jgi:hypothetical protein
VSAGDEFGARYAAALHSALAEAGEGSLSAAYDLGRVAVRQELSVLDLAAIHNEALVRALGSAADAEAAARAAATAGDFFLESLSAYEMLERVLRERHEVARAEERHAALLRRLSGFLGDASLAVDANASMQEVLQLVAEHALEVVAADACSARLGPSAGGGATLEAVASSGAPAAPEAAADTRLPALYATLRPDGGPVRLTAAELAGQLPDAAFAWLAAPFTALDGRPLGLIQLFGFAGDRRFSELDETVLAQLAQMASATFERMELYRR